MERTKIGMALALAFCIGWIGSQALRDVGVIEKAQAQEVTVEEMVESVLDEKASEKSEGSIVIDEGELVGLGYGSFVSYDPDTMTAYLWYKGCYENIDEEGYCRSESRKLRAISKWSIEDDGIWEPKAGTAIQAYE